MSKNPKERIKELRTLLHHYNVEYYVHSRSLISDFEFDHLMKELEELEAVSYTHLTLPTKA